MTSFLHLNPLFSHFNTFLITNHITYSFTIYYDILRLHKKNSIIFHYSFWFIQSPSAFDILGGRPTLLWGFSWIGGFSSTGWVAGTSLLFRDAILLLDLEAVVFSFGFFDFAVFNEDGSVGGEADVGAWFGGGDYELSIL